jgi:nicotinamide mononucleotide transporter
MMVENNSFSELIATVPAFMSGWELVAVVLALLYLLLAMKERIECWYAAFVSTGIYIFLFWDVSLLMESALQVYYLAMAVYGWWQWRKKNDQSEGLIIHVWSFRQHAIAIATVALLVLVSGYLLAENTTAALPYLDSFTTWGAVITTYMVTQKVLENWLYWIVIDGVSVFLYIDRELYMTAVLFVLYVVIVVIGFLQWLPRYRQQQLVNYQSEIDDLFDK